MRVVNRAVLPASRRTGPAVERETEEALSARVAAEVKRAMLILALVATVGMMLGTLWK